MHRARTAHRVERFRAARRDPHLAVLEGFHALKHALRFGAEVLEVVTTDADALRALAGSLAPDILPALAADGPAAPSVLDEGEYASLAPHPHHTGVMALARRRIADPALLLSGPPPESPLVLLEAPTDPGNVGAAVRAAAAAGAAGLLTCGGADPWSPAALRGSAGLHFALPVARIEAEGITKELARSTRPLIAVDPAGEPLQPGCLDPGAVLAFGTERGGLGEGLRARASRRVAIPMRPGVSSLNLATAVAVVLYLARPVGGVMSGFADRDGA